MKSLLIATILMIGSLAAAESGVRAYSITGANFNPQHVKTFVSGTMLLNYDEGTLSLKVVDDNNRCTPGTYCVLDAQNLVFLPAKILEVSLPITSIKIDSCGVRHVKAVRDSRPADGDLQVLYIEDASHMTCQTFVKYAEQASYVTKFFDRLSNKEVNARSTMNVDGVDQNVAYYNFADGEFTEGFPGVEVPTGGSLKFNNFKAEMIIQVGLACPANESCATYLPNPLQVNLPVVEIEQLSCSRKLTARQVINHDFGDVETIELVIEDFSQSTCDGTSLHLATAQYQDTYVNNKGIRYVKAGHFSFDAGL